jgi:hypothetical protein
VDTEGNEFNVDDEELELRAKEHAEEEAKTSAKPLTRQNTVWETAQQSIDNQRQQMKDMGDDSDLYGEEVQP